VSRYAIDHVSAGQEQAVKELRGPFRPANALTRATGGSEAQTKGFFDPNIARFSTLSPKDKSDHPDMLARFVASDQLCER